MGRLSMRCGDCVWWYEGPLMCDGCPNNPETSTAWNPCEGCILQDEGLFLCTTCPNDFKQNNIQEIRII